MSIDPSLRRVSCCVLVPLMASACTDGLVSPGLIPGPAHLTAEYICTVDVMTGTTSCRPSSLTVADAARLNLLLGSPNVTIASSGAVSSRGNAADPDTTTTSMTVKNNIPQPMGTTDGVNAHVDGIRMLFSSGPTVTAVNSGTIAGSFIMLANADGTGTFTNPEGTLNYINKPYYQYDGILAHNATSSAKAVRFIFSSNVRTFSFAVRVSAPVQYEYGWITIFPSSTPVLEPGDTTTLWGIVYNQLGVGQGDGITWSSSNSAVATVNASTGKVTAVGNGTAIITATSTVNAQRTGTRTIAVDEAPEVMSTTPQDNASPVAADENIMIFFNEAVNVSTSSFLLECPIGEDSQSFTVSGSGTSAVTLDPDVDLPEQAICTVTVEASVVSDADLRDGPDVMYANHVFSFEVGITIDP